jgi:phospholipase/carboxylesterase
MHGLGDTAEGFLDVFNSPINPCKPTTKIVLLTAPQRSV